MTTIWVVEDDDVVAQLVIELLAASHYKVTRYPGGQHAIDALSRDELPDLMILDIRMPKPDGNDVLRFMKGRNHPPILVLTGFAEMIEQDLRDVYKAVITKPFEYTDLIHKVEQYKAHKDAQKGQTQH